MRFVMRVLSGSSSGATYPVRERLMLGRSPVADVQLVHEGASRFHALIERQPDGRHAIADLETTSGVRVDGRAVRRAVLVPGNVVEICGIELRYEALADEASEQSVPKTIGVVAVRPTTRAIPKLGDATDAADRRAAAAVSRNPTSSDHGWVALVRDVMDYRAMHRGEDPGFPRADRLIAMFAEPPLFAGKSSRRATRRHPCTMPVQLTTRRGEVDHPSRAMVLDLGGGGLRVHTLAGLDEGERCRIDVLGGNGLSLGIGFVAEVVWIDTERGHVGLRFVE